MCSTKAVQCRKVSVSKLTNETFSQSIFFSQAFLPHLFANLPSLSVSTVTSNMHVRIGSLASLYCRFMFLSSNLCSSPDQNSHCFRNGNNQLGKKCNHDTGFDAHTPSLLPLTIQHFPPNFKIHCSSYSVRDLVNRSKKKTLITYIMKIWRIEAIHSFMIFNDEVCQQCVFLHKYHFVIWGKMWGK